MIRVALRGLAGRKLRAFLTSLAIVLGVAMVSGTLVLTDMIDRAFNQIFTESYAKTDAVVSGKSAGFSFQGEQAATPPVSSSLLPRIRAVPDVRAAAGFVSDESATKIIGRNGKPITPNGPTFGFGADFSEARFNPLNLTAGRWPRTSAEAAIDVSTAKEQHFKVGQTIRIATLKPVRPFKLVGTAKYGSVESLGSATFAVFTIPTAQNLLDRQGEFDAISVAGKQGVSEEKLVKEIEAVIPANKAEVRTREQQVKEAKKDVEFTKYIRYFLLSFAGIALFVGAFVIFNTLSITVAQRIRELATLRTIGASRRQLLGSITVESLTIGLLASVIGLVLGVGLAEGLNALFKAFNNDLPTTGLILATRTIVASMLIGTGVTLVAGLAPAIRATKVPPIAAVREGATLPRGRLAPFVPYIALGVVALAVALLGYGMFANDVDTILRLLSLGVGCLLLFIGVALVSPRLVPRLARIVRPIAKWVMLGVGALVYPTRLGAWLVRRALFRRGLTVGQRLLAHVGGFLLLFVVGPGLLAAAALLLTKLSVAIGYGLLTAVVVLEAVLLCWYVIVVVSRFPRVVALALVIVWGVLFLGLALLVALNFSAGALAGLALPALVVLGTVLGLISRGRGFPSDLPDLRFDPATDRLSSENSRRNPGRTAATAAALMIGLALVTFIAVLANGIKVSNRGAIEDQVKSDYMITSGNGFESISPAAGDAIARASEVAVASSVRSDIGKVAGSGQQVTGIDPKTITRVYHFEWKDGSNASVERLGPYGAIVDKNFAEDKNLEIGSRFPLLTPNGDETLLEVKGIYKAPPFYPLLGAVSISQAFFDRIYERPQNLFTFIDTRVPASDATEAELKSALINFPDAKVQTREAWISDQDKDLDNFLITLYVLLALAVVVSLFGMVNTLVLSVFERTRELGMLRAVGMTRNQVARMVRQESVITALIGAALGLPLGIFLAVLVTKALAQFEFELAPPWKNLIAFAIVSMIVGVLASVAPARRASRLNVLRALQYE